MKKITTLAAAALLAVAGTSAFAEEHVQIGGCENIQKTGAICQIFFEPTEINPETTATGITRDEVERLNPGIEQHFNGKKLKPLVEFRIG